MLHPSLSILPQANPSRPFIAQLILDLVGVGESSLAFPPTAQAGEHPEPPMMMAVGMIVEPIFIFPVLTSWP
jgi:hypothetical protein